MKIPFPPTCQECGKPCDRGYRTLYGPETSFNPYKFCSTLCIVAWLIPYYISAARTAATKRDPIKRAVMKKEIGANEGCVRLLSGDKIGASGALFEIGQFLTPIQMEVSALCMLFAVWLTGVKGKNSQREKHEKA